MADHLPFFVYGTLRPDDPSNAPWRDAFLSGCIAQRRAFMPNALLFLSDYPSAVLLDDIPPDQLCSLQRQEQQQKQQCCPVQGHLLWFPETLSAAKLKQGDEIEEVPVLYRRSIVAAHPLDAAETRPAGAHALQHQPLHAYVYHRSWDQLNCPFQLLPHGDWVLANKPSLNHTNDQTAAAARQCHPGPTVFNP